MGSQFVRTAFWKQVLLILRRTKLSGTLLYLLLDSSYFNHSWLLGTFHWRFCRLGMVSLSSTGHSFYENGWKPFLWTQPYRLSLIRGLMVFVRRPFIILCNLGFVFCWSHYADRVLYTSERWASIFAEAAKEDSIYTLDDRMGLIQDSMELSRAGLTKLSSLLTFVDMLKNEKECMYFTFIYLNSTVLLLCSSCMAGHCGLHFGRPGCMVGEPGNLRQTPVIPSSKLLC